jgi:undecaprenyl-phosphate 4-deoxy-4-formamido-L-arabinose transferase
VIAPGRTAEKAVRAPRVSIVIPVFNEEENLPALWERLRPVLDGIGGGAEVVFADDGSSDRSLEILRGLAAADRRVRALSFNRNYGQHAAVMAAFERARGEVVVTLDADLQNPPEEIPKLLAAIDAGADVAAGRRVERKDSLFRKVASRITNRMMAKAIGVDLHDYGCMLRAYRADVVRSMTACRERSTFIPALACRFARRIEEVPVDHAERGRGESKYSFWKLLKLQADLVTGFTALPLRMVAAFGLAIALVSAAFGAFLLVMRILRGPEWAAFGVFTLFAVLFFLVGAQMLALGILGEYVARIFDEVRSRPRSVIREVIEPSEEGPLA